MKNIPSNFQEYQAIYQQSIEQPELFWEAIADDFVWRKKWDKVLSWNFNEPSVKWFEGGQLNITENCLDRHLADKADQTAIIWEPNNPNDAHRTLTYQALYNQVCLFANVLKNRGVVKGDRVCIYMPMVPELVIAVLACARIGAIHSVIFGGFSAQSIADRIQDAGAKMVITADGAFRGEKDIPLKLIIDDALVRCSSIEKVIVLNRTNTPVRMLKNRDFWWHEEMEMAEEMGLTSCEPELMDAEDMLFILYTSGSTGKPKGVVHTCGGYMVYTAYTFKNVFNYQDNDVFWCTADIGWITGHSYILYGPLLNGATTVLFEGIPSYPTFSRFWETIE